jgi:hypothetical protein
MTPNVPMSETGTAARDECRADVAEKTKTTRMTSRIEIQR